jgi:hypothetical protein
MRTLKLVIMTAATALTCLTAGAAAAQSRPTDDMEILREKLRADKKLVLAATLQLTDAEGKAFWPVYNAYQSDMIQHYDRVLALIDNFSKSYQNLSDEAARKLISEFLALQTNHPAVLKKYAPQFLQVLPAKKVAQLYQVENKLRALVDYDLAQSIPLIK